MKIKKFKKWLLLNASIVTTIFSFSSCSNSSIQNDNIKEDAKSNQNQNSDFKKNSNSPTENKENEVSTQENNESSVNQNAESNNSQELSNQKESNVSVQNEENKVSTQENNNSSVNQNAENNNSQELSNQKESNVSVQNEENKVSTQGNNDSSVNQNTTVVENIASANPIQKNNVPVKNKGWEFDDESFDTKTYIESGDNNFINEEEEINEISTIRVGHWNTGNFFNSTTKAEAISKIINFNKISIIGLTEISSNGHGTKKLLEMLRKLDPESKWKSIHSEKIAKVGRESSKEWISILYKSKFAKPIPFAGYENLTNPYLMGLTYFNPEFKSAFSEETTSYVRPPFGAKFQLNNKSRKTFTLVFSHNDSPGAKEKYGEISVPNFLGSQGNQEIDEALKLNEVMQWFDEKDGENNALIYMGDTNIRKGNGDKAFQPLRENGFISAFDENFLTSLKQSKKNGGFNDALDRMFYKNLKIINQNKYNNWNVFDDGILNEEIWKQQIDQNKRKYGKEPFKKDGYYIYYGISDHAPIFGDIVVREETENNTQKNEISKENSQEETKKTLDSNENQDANDQNIEKTNLKNSNQENNTSSQLSPEKPIIQENQTTNTNENDIKSKTDDLNINQVENPENKTKIKISYLRVKQTSMKKGEENKISQLILNSDSNIIIIKGITNNKEAPKILNDKLNELNAENQWNFIINNEIKTRLKTIIFYKENQISISEPITTEQIENFDNKNLPFGNIITINNKNFTIINSDVTLKTNNQNIENLLLDIDNKDGENNKILLIANNEKGKKDFSINNYDNLETFINKGKKEIFFKNLEVSEIIKNENKEMISFNIII